MKNYPIPIKFIVPIIEIETQFSYFPLQKPSGINFMFLVLMKDYPEKTHLVKNVLKHFGLAEDVNRIVAEEIVIMIKNDVITCSQEFSVEMFPTYKLEDFHFTPRGEVVFDRQYIQSEQEKQKNITLWNKPYSTGFYELLINRPYGGDVTIEDGEMWKTYFEKIKIKDDDEYKKAFGLLSNQKLGIKSQENIGEVTILEQTIHLTTLPAKLMIASDGTCSLFDQNKDLYTFLSIYYDAKMFSELIAWNKKMYAKFSPTESITLFDKVDKIAWNTTDLFDTKKKTYKVLNSKENEGSGGGVLFASFFFDNFKDFEEIIFTENQPIIGIGKTNLVTLNILFDQEISLPIVYTQHLRANQLEEHLTKYLTTQHEFNQETMTCIYKMENFIHNHQPSIRWLKKYVLETPQAYNRLLEMIHVAPMYPFWKNELQTIALKIYNEMVSELANTSNLDMLENVLSLSKFMAQKPIEFIEIISKSFKSFPPMALYEKLTNLNFIDKDILVFINPLPSFIQESLNGLSPEPIDKLTIQISRYIERYLSLKSMLGLDQLTDFPIDEGLNYKTFLVDFNQFASIHNYLNGYRRYLPEEFLKTANRFYEIFQESAIYARHLQNRENSNTAFSILEIENYLKGPTRDKLRTIVIELSCIVEGVGKSSWKENPRATLDEFIDYFYNKKWISQEEKLMLKDLKQWRNSLVHPDRGSVDQSNDQLESYAHLVLSLSQRVNSHE